MSNLAVPEKSNTALLKYTDLIRCEKCEMHFINDLAFYSHFERNKDSGNSCYLFEKEPTKSETTTDINMADNHVCFVCETTFHSKFDLARHIFSSLIKSNEAITNHESVKQLSSVLQPYQCQICIRFCSSLEEFLEHISSGEHQEAVDKLCNAMTCLTCKFTSASKKDIYLHFKDGHSASDILHEACILMETPGDVSCEACGEIFDCSLLHRIHVESEHHADVNVKSRHWCDFCEKSFSTSSNLAMHKRRKHAENTFHCEPCSKSYCCKGDYDVHCRSAGHIEKLGLKTVGFSEMIGSANRSENHHTEINEVNSDAIDAPESETVAASVSMDKGTVRMKKKPGPKAKNNPTSPSVCDLCGHQFRLQANLAHHLTSWRHQRNKQDAEMPSAICQQCDVCGLKFYNDERYKLHRLIHKDKGTSATERRLQGIPAQYHSLVTTMTKVPTREVQCPACQGWFKGSTIIPHIRSKHGEGDRLPFKCKFCQKAFPSNSSLYRHHKTHLGVKSFYCVLCNRGYRSKADLDTHHLAVHNDIMGIKPKFQCDICGGGFMLESKLRQHVREKHEQVRNFWCKWPGCNRSFKHRQEFKVHWRGHTGEKPYLCNTCGFSTKTKVQLSRHERIHNNVANFKCPHCPFTARLSAGLRRHVRLHTGAKPFKCPHCDHRSYSHTNLRAHINHSQAHPGLKLYNCKTCATFGTNSTTEFLQHTFDQHGLRPEEISHVGEYCGIYIPDEDITEVKPGQLPRMVKERKPKKPRRKVYEHTVIIQTDTGDYQFQVRGHPEQAGTYIMESHGLDFTPEIQKQIIEHIQMIEKTKMRPNQVAEVKTSAELLPSTESATEQSNIQIIRQIPVPNMEILKEVQISGVEQEILTSISNVTAMNIEEESTDEIDDDDQTTNTIQYAELYQKTKNTIEMIQTEGELAARKTATEKTLKQVDVAVQGAALSNVLQDGNVTELSIDLEIPKGKPGQIIEIMGRDNQPIQFCYV